MLLASAALAAPVAASAQAAPPNHPPRPLFTPADALLLGGFAAGTVLAFPLDRDVAIRLQHPDVQTRRFLRASAAFVGNVAAPGSFLIGGTMYVVGRARGNKALADVGLHGTEALVIGTVVGGVMKIALGRARPHVYEEPNPRAFRLGRGLQGFSDDWQSFPSGHTIAAFAAAAAVTSETNRYWPGYTWLIAPAMYGGAALAGVSRMYHNRHWATDVITGAAIGTFAGLKVVRYHHTNPDNRIDRVLLNFSIAPAPAGGGRTVGFSVIPMRR
jgi:membrane-associated phospholipid phosphatase